MMFSYFLLHTNSRLDVDRTPPDARRFRGIPQHGIEYFTYEDKGQLPYLDQYERMLWSFDLLYNGASITARYGKGFNTVLRDVDTLASSFFISCNMTNETFVATQEFEYISDDILKIITKVKNLADVPKRIDLGFYMDPSLGGNDSPIISILDGDKGLKFTQNDGKDFILVLKDGFGVTNVDHYFYGSTDGHSKVFFATEDQIDHEAEPGSFDAMLSFSYRNREILPGETASFVQTLTVGVNVKLPPDFYFTDLKKVYPIGVESTLNGFYDSPEENRQLTLTKTFDGQSYPNDTFTTTADNKRQPFSIKFTPNNGRGPYILDVTVTDQDTQKYHQRVEIYANTAPTIVDNSVRKEIYEISESVPINVQITDDTSATYFYQIDNGEKHYGKFVESNGEAKTFEFTIPVGNLTLDQHSVVVRAIDADGTLASNEIPSFNFRVVKKPVITITTEERPTYNIGENVTVNVTVDNENENAEVTIYAKFGEGEFKPVTLNSPTAVFEIPYTAEEGNTTITFFAKDSFGQVTENKTISFEIKSIPLAPVVKLISTDKESYTIGENVTVTFSIFDYNKEEHANIMVRLGDDNEFVLMMENVTITKNSSEYTVKVTGPNVTGDHNITLYAVDKDNLSSEHVQTLVKFNAAPPVVIPPGGGDNPEGGDDKPEGDGDKPEGDGDKPEGDGDKPEGGDDKSGGDNPEGDGDKPEGGDDKSGGDNPEGGDDKPEGDGDKSGDNPEGGDDKSGDDNPEGGDDKSGDDNPEGGDDKPKDDTPVKPTGGEGGSADGKGNIIDGGTDKDKDDKDDDKLFPLWIVLAVLAACLLIIILALIVYFNSRKHEEEEEKNEDEKSITSAYPDYIPDFDDDHDMGSGESVEINDSDVIPV